MDEQKWIEIGFQPWTIENVLEIAQGKTLVRLSNNKKWQKTITDGADFLKKSWTANQEIYGVTTGYGDSGERAVPPALAKELPLHLTRFHGCGMGQLLDIPTAKAVLAVRSTSLALGVSGVRMQILERLCELINQSIIPLIPEEGSVGASGDLTPLSYVGAVLVGEREVFYQGERMATLKVYRDLGLTPIRLEPKEGLAIMNGTSVMTAMACLAYDRAQYLAKMASRITAMAVEILRGNKAHFDERLYQAKPHPGQMQVAKWIREDIGYSSSSAQKFRRRLQDQYSIRCAPHVIGVLMDSLPWMRDFIETELNSANDNPLIDVEQEDFLHGGNFYGGHIAFAMDSMKNAVANIADLLDRQLALMVDQRYNHGLPANLSGSSSERASVNHGFKAVQIATSAWTAEALKLTMPASVFSRSTECHNQDKVSMGTIAARDCLRVLELTEQVTVALLMAVTQGLEIRLRKGEIKESDLNPELLATKKSVDKHFRFLDEDRPLEQTLRKMMDLTHKKNWDFYS